MKKEIVGGVVLGGLMLTSQVVPVFCHKETCEIKEEPHVELSSHSVAFPGSMSVSSISGVTGSTTTTTLWTPGIIKS